MRFSRTRAGCLTCRSRRKKCDEVKPRCAGCRRNQLPCNWPPTTPSEGPDKPRSSRASSSTARGSGTSTPSQRLLEETSTAVTRHTTPASSNIPSSVPTIYRGAESDTQRACTLTQQSVTLLSHFLMHTASLFAMGPMESNPFVTVLLPLAYTDDLLMHSLLALSGAHLASKVPDSPDFSRATRIHYSKLIGGLRNEFSGLEDGDLCNKERLLRLLMVACHYEAVSGNTHGAMFSHLYAGRHLVTSLVTQGGKLGHPGHTAVDSGTLGFSLELYTYIMLCNTIFMPPTTDLPFHADDFAMPLGDMACFPTFGALFAGSHELYGLIPEIDELATQRLAEEADGSKEPSLSIRESRDRLYDTVNNWEMPPPSWPGERDRELKIYAAEALRHGLHIYLVTSLAGSTVLNQETRSVINTHVAGLFGYVGELIASQQNYIATLLWPAIIGASCIIKSAPQQDIIRVFRESWSEVRHMGILADILQLMWDDPDPRAYGPYGLRMTMQKHGKVVGIL